MKLKSIAVATVAALGFMSTAMADEGHGKITFFGSVIDAPCSIKAGDEEQRIDLGQVSSAALENQGTSTPVPFYINLENCKIGTDGTKNKVQVTFTGAAATIPTDENDSSKLLGITGTAKGVGVAMTTQNTSEVISLGKPTDEQTLTDGNNTLAFAAYVQADGSGTTIVEGNFEAVTDFRLSYN